MQQAFLNYLRGMPGELPPPVEAMNGRWSLSEQSEVERKLHYSVAGAPGTVRRYLERLIAGTDADELILTANVFEHAARVHSFEIAAAVMEQINGARTANADASFAQANFRGLR